MTPDVVCFCVCRCLLNLIKKYQKPLTYFTYQYTKNQESAEDIVQDVFIYLLCNKEKYDFNYSLKAYLYLIARTRSFSFIKKEKRRPEIEKTYYDNSFWEELEEMIDRKLEKEQMIEEIARLKEEYRTAIFLIDIEGLSYIETAQIMRKTLGQLKVLIHRARKKLKTNIERRVIS